MRQLDAYVRVSRTGGRSGESFIAPDEQRRRIEEWAAAHDIEVIRWWEELDQSGGRMERPKFQRILQRIKAGETDGIIVADRSRFARSLVGALTVIDELNSLDATFAAADGLDSSTPEGRLAINVMLSFAQYELERIKHAWQAATSRAVRDGVHISAKVPFGYKRAGKRTRLEVDKPKAKIVKEIYKRRVGGASWTALVDYVAEKGHPMSQSGLMALVKNPVYLGQARASQQVVNDLAHEPLVDRDLWEAAQPGGLTHARNGSLSGTTLLRGIARCEECGYRLSVTSRPNRKGGPKDTTYFCKGRSASGKCAAPAAMDTKRLDQFVLDRLTERFQSGDAAVWSVLQDDQRREDAKATVDAAEEELKEYVTTVSVAQIGRELYTAGLEARQEAVRESRRRLNEIQASSARDFPALESEWTVEDARADLTRFTEGVFVARADPKRRRWQPIEERVRIVWRGESDRA